MNAPISPSLSIRPRHAVDLGHAVDVAATPICTIPGSFGERARSRSARAGSCFLLHRRYSNHGHGRSDNAT